jgi:GNAT superfamily N-acetyltransferase
MTVPQSEFPAYRLTTPRAPAIEVMHRYAMNDSKNEVIAHVEVCDRDGVYWLTNLWVHADYRKGRRSVALMERALQDWADTRDLYLAVQPYVDQPLSAERLIVFYRTFGFRQTEVPGVMIRKAQPWLGRGPTEMP